MLPTIGRVVHYEPFEGGLLQGPLAAIVTKVDEDGSVDLCAFIPNPMPVLNAPPADEPTPGCWNWPPRV